MMKNLFGAMGMDPNAAGGAMPGMGGFPGMGAMGGMPGMPDMGNPPAGG